jgi:hypothetical protein
MTTARMKCFTALLAVVVLASCGSKPKPATPIDSTKHEGHAAHDEHANMPPDVVKFHDLLSPRWHAEKGAQRTKDTCAAAADFATTADALAKLPTPAGGDATRWAASTKELTDAVAALKTSCDAHDDAAFEETFHHVHVGFHHVAEAAGGEPEHHDEGHDEGHEE